MKRKRMMKITHWSDFNCPYSYIGLKRLTDALNELDLKPEWELKAFELEPALTNEPTADMLTRHAVKFALTEKQAMDEIREIDDIAREDDLDINYGGVKLTSSRNAHRLVKFAQNRYPHLSVELVFKIYEANFKNNEVISDADVLCRIAAEVGLDEDDTRNVLDNNSFDIEVSLDMEDARFNGLNAVPFYILTYEEEQLSVPGAFEKEDFKIALKDLINGEIRYKSFI